MDICSPLFLIEVKFSQLMVIGFCIVLSQMSPFEGAPEDFDQTIFAVKDSTIGPVEGLALNLVKEQQR